MKLAGGDRFKGSGVLCAGAHELSFKDRCAGVEGRDKGDGWLIAAVEFADNPSRHESHIGLVLTGAPPLQQLREVLPPGSILVITDQESL